MAITITLLPGGGKLNNQKSLAILQIRRLRVKTFDNT
jgi:hypothetical protein